MPVFVSISASLLLPYALLFYFVLPSDSLSTSGLIKAPEVVTCPHLLISGVPPQNTSAVLQCLPPSPRPAPGGGTFR